MRAAWSDLRSVLNQEVLRSPELCSTDLLHALSVLLLRLREAQMRPGDARPSLDDGIEILRIIETDEQVLVCGSVWWIDQRRDPLALLLRRQQERLTPLTLVCGLPQPVEPERVNMGWFETPDWWERGQWVYRADAPGGPPASGSGTPGPGRS